jgi:hypothetical protein
MAIVSTDLKLLASARMNDAADGGGEMTGVVLQDGAENNVFPDISSTDRAFGRLQMRKVYAAVLQATGTDTLLGANVILQRGSADTNVAEFGMLSTGATEDRADVLGRLERSHWEPRGSNSDTADMTWAGATTLTAGTVTPAVGMVLCWITGANVFRGPVRLTSVVSAGGSNYTVAYEGTVSTPPANTEKAFLATPATTGPRFACVRDVSGTLSVGATQCDVDSLVVQVVPKQIGSLPGTEDKTGIDGTAVPAGGTGLGMRAGDGLVIHHTDTVAAATYSNGATVNVGRTDLAGVRIVGLDNLGITAGWSVDLATGVVSITNVTGWSQPVVVHHTIEEVVAISRTGYPEWQGGTVDGVSDSVAGPFTLSSGIVMFAGRVNVGRIQVISRQGLDITTALSSVGGGMFGADLAAGTMTFSGNSTDIANHSPVTLVASGTYTLPSSPSAPLSVLDRVVFNRPLTRAFPSGTKVSNMLFMGDMQAQAGAVWSQTAWTEVWADVVIGSTPAGQYSDNTNPIAVSNLGSITERWAVIFLTSTTFKVIGQSAGQVTTGNTASVLAPINPATGAPYFTIAAAGWGSGWVGGNVLRFNTRGPSAAVWVGRATLPSAPNSTSDSILLSMRGDINQ